MVGVVIVIALVVLIVYLNDGLRKWVRGKVKRAGAKIREGWELAKPHVSSTLEDLAENRMESRRLWSELEHDLGLPKRSNG